MIRLPAIALFLGLALPATAQAAPAADFGSGAAACARLLAAGTYDEKVLEADGWKKSAERGSIRVYSRDGVSVKLFLSAMLGSNSCVVDGYADKGDTVKDLSAAIAASLRPIAGDELKIPESSIPSGQGFAFGSVMQILSTEERAAGLSVRITGMAM